MHNATRVTYRVTLNNIRLHYIFKDDIFDSRAHRKLVALQSKRQHESTDADVAAAAAAVETRVHEVLEQKLLSSIRPRSVCTRKTVMN